MSLADFQTAVDSSYRAFMGGTELDQVRAGDTLLKQYSEPVEIGRNKWVDPAATSLSNYAANYGVNGAGNITIQTGATPFDAVNTYVRMTWTQSATSKDGPWGYRGVGAGRVTELAATGTTISVYARPSVTKTLRIQTNAQHAGQLTACPANAWTRVTLTVIPGTSASYDFRVYAHGDTDAWQAGQTLDVTAVMVKDGTTLSPFFTPGLTPPDTFAVWSGPVNASPSILYGWP